MGKLSRYSTNWKMKITKQYDLMILILVKKQYVLMGAYICIYANQTGIPYIKMLTVNLYVQQGQVIFTFFSLLPFLQQTCITFVAGAPGRKISIFHSIFCLIFDRVEKQHFQKLYRVAF